MRLIYLDQWAWIHLARAYHGKQSNRASKPILEFLSAAKESGEARFPLSLAHYYETSKHGNPESRLRLAEVMIKFSEFDTLASINDVVRHEVERALKRKFSSQIVEHPFSVLGKGVKHASGYWRDLNIVKKKGMSLDEYQALKSYANYCFELSTLVGGDAFGSGIRGSTECPGGQDFVRLLSDLPKEVETIPEYGLEAYFSGRCINDIRTVIEEVLLSSSLSWDDFEGLSHLEKIQFVNELPTRRVEKHLMNQFAKNLGLPKRESDLNDWSYLGVAVSYCDIVVAEKQFTDLINRKGLIKKAVVISDLLKLPSV